MTKIICGAVAAAAGLLFFTANGMAVETKPTITLDVAKKMAAACEAKAKQQKWLMNIAVVDDGANLVYFEQMDGAFKGSNYIAQHKAMSSANFPFPTRFFGELSFGKDGKPAAVPGLPEVPGLITFAGGLPIMTASKAHIGGIGVSGGTADQDEDCAKAGLDAVQDDLK
jgi:glc operon protein GlcG